MLFRTYKSATAILVALCLFIPSAFAQSGAKKEATYIVAGKAIYFLVHYVAVEAGFFKQNDLTIDPVVMTSGAKVVAALIGGDADAAAGTMMTTIQANEKGRNLVVIASIYDAFSQSLVLSNAAIARTGIKPDMSTDEKVKRLKGLKIGISSPGSGSDQLVRTLFVTRGLNPDEQVELIPLGQGDAMVAALERGAIDGFSFALPFPQIAESKGLGKTIIDPFLGQTPEMQGGTTIVLVTSPDRIQKNRPALAALVRSYAQAIKFINEHPDQARSMAYKYFTEMDENIFNSMFEKAVTGIPKTPVVSEEQFEKTIDSINITAKTPIKAAYSQTIDNSLAIEAAKDVLAQ